VFEWYKKSAESGDAISQNNVGVYYDRGSGIERNAQLAVFWYRKAAEQGHASAQNNLAACYEEGFGVSKSLSQALYWYQKAAEQGDYSAQNNLGYYYQYAIGVKKNSTEAVKCYEKAAIQGYDIAQCNLAKCYYDGDGITKNFEKSAFWYRKAAEQGDDVAQLSLGKMYLKGQGLPIDYKRALEYLICASKINPTASLTKKLSEFEKGFLLNALLSQEWPFTHHKLNTDCQKTILELYNIHEKVEICQNLPHELLVIIVKFIIRFWPENQPHMPFYSSMDSEEDGNGGYEIRSPNLEIQT